MHPDYLFHIRQRKRAARKMVEDIIVSKFGVMVADQILQLIIDGKLLLPEGEREEKSEVPKEVYSQVIQWAKERAIDVPELSWDGVMSCWYFVYQGKYFGVERNGYIYDGIAHPPWWFKK